MKKVSDISCIHTDDSSWVVGDFSWGYEQDFDVDCIPGLQVSIHMDDVGATLCLNDQLGVIEMQYLGAVNVEF